jgi:hypothetical protein
MQVPLGLRSGISGNLALVPLKAFVHLPVIFIPNSFKPVKISPQPYGHVLT